MWPERLNRHTSKPTIDDHFDAGDELPGVAAGEEKGGAHEFVGIAEPLHGGAGEDFFDAFWSEDFAVLFCGEEPWDERVDADAVRSPLSGEVFAEVVHGGFAQGVSEDAAQRNHAGHAAEVDDAGGDFLLDEILSKNLTAENDGTYVDVHNAVVFLFRDVEKWRCRVGARSIDENVARAGFLKHGGEEEFDAGFFAGFDFHKISFSTCGMDFGEPGVRLFLTASREDNFGSRSSQSLGHGSAEFTSAADDDSGLAFE